MKIAYIILAHQNPEQVVRLINRLNEPNTYFAIHIDRKANDNVYQDVAKALRNEPNVSLIKRHPIYWGELGMVSATLEGIESLLKEKIPYDYAILLSGQHYPIKTNEQIKNFLQKSRGKSFIEHSWFSKKHWPGRFRIEHWCVAFNFFGRRKFYLSPDYLLLNLKDSKYPILRALGRLPDSGLFPRRKFLDGFEPYGGGQWWCLDRDCVEYVSDFIRKRPDFMKYFRFTRLPEEVIFQTIILNSYLRDRVVDKSLTYTRWPAGGRSAHPVILRENDFGDLAACPELFARKFDINTEKEILDIIDDKLLGVRTVQSHEPTSRLE